MREILFRGKRADNGEWVCSGNLIHFNEYNECHIPTANSECTCTHDENDNIIEWKKVMFCKVLPETVGQYTGLTDKSGNKIFEGDIVKCTDKINDYSFTAVVMFGNPNGEYNWGFQLKRIKGANANTDILLWVEMGDTGAYIEVIGNIYDNPELLEVQNEQG